MESAGGCGCFGIFFCRPRPNGTDGLRHGQEDIAEGLRWWGEDSVLSQYIGMRSATGMLQKGAAGAMNGGGSA